jgi:hypothetical protein
METKRFAFFFACIGFTLELTQMYAQPAYKEIRPSVNAQQFISAASGNNSLHTGQLSISIPLLNLQGKGINVPISLFFGADGIMHRSEASNIGLGWSLLAGGVITQSIRDVNDFEHSRPSEVPWQYQYDFLQRKWEEQANSPYSDIVTMGLNTVGLDQEPDIFKYSFQGYSGDICLRYKDDGTKLWTLYPDKSFRMEKTTLGFKIVTSDGVEYWFEAGEEKGLNSKTQPLGWFLSKIKTAQGGSVTFQYADDYAEDLTNIEPGTVVERSKRLTRIDYDYGYVIFTSSGRDDRKYSDLSKTSQRITNIELYDNEGSLVKGYKFDNAANFFTGNQTSASSSHDNRLKLKSISEYDRNGRYLPPYTFEYSNYFAFSKSYRPDPIVYSGAINTWAYNPAALASVDRNFYGNPIPWIEKTCYEICCPNGLQCRTDAYGITTTFDPISASVGDYLCLTKIKFPTGGSESYYYEAHNYAYLSRSPESITTASTLIMGKRLLKKEITDGSGNTQVLQYKYLLHDQNYQPNGSSGVLVNPSIHTSTMYKPVYDRGKIRLGASPFYTVSPQNTLSGSPIYYREVEEIYLSGLGEQNGKKIYYFYVVPSLPAVNYVYLNYNPLMNMGKANLLIPTSNTLYGKHQYMTDTPPELDLSGLSNVNYTYLAYPVGRFYESNAYTGKVLKEVTLNTSGNMVKKVVNQYDNVRGEELYGLIVEKFDDSPGSYPSKLRYLVSHTQTAFMNLQLSRSTTTHYYQNDSLTEEQAFTYWGTRLKSTSVTQSNGVNSMVENVYPDQVYFQASSNLSAQALSIKKLKELNMIETPLQTTQRNGTKFVQGNYTTFKQLSSGAVVKDSLFTLSVQPGAVVWEPVVNTSGKIERSRNFIPLATYVAYDANLNPTTTVGKDGIIETVVWGHGGKYPLAKIVNYTDVQLQANTTLLNQIKLLDNYTAISDADKANLLSTNQAIRNNLPANVIITTYTHDPFAGVTSQTDHNGQTIYYKYDSFNRLYRIYDHAGNILNEYHYNYQK